MYVKTSVRKTKNGEVRYLQLAHNEWDAALRQSVPKVVYSFGREDQLDKGAIRRLVASLSRLLEPGAALAATADGELAFAESRPYGGAYVLDALWHRLGIGKILAGLAPSGRGRPRDAAAAERVLFGLVASRALAPSSKLAAAEWMSRDVHIDGLGEVSDDACYRAMDWLHDVRGELEKQVYVAAADLLNLEVDLLFFDTASTYFELEDADEEVAPNWRGEGPGDKDADPDQAAGFRAHGKSQDRRDDLPKIVIGLAVTRDGIPVRVWCWPRDTADSALIRRVRQDIRDWSLGKIIWVADRGLSSAGNRRFLLQGAGGCIIGEKLRSGSPHVEAALSRPGRYQRAAGNLQIKEIRIADSADRFVICYNPEAAARDAAVRDDLIAKLEETIAGSDNLSATKRAELRAKISNLPGLNRFLRVTPGGLLRVDRTKARTEESTCCAAPTRYCLPRTSPWATGSCWKSNAAGGTCSRSWTFGPSTTGSKNASAPMSCCAGSRYYWSAWPRTRPGRPGPPCAANSTASTSPPSPDPPGPAGSAPRSASPPATCSPNSASTRLARSTNSRRHLTPAPRSRLRAP